MKHTRKILVALLVLMTILVSLAAVTIPASAANEEGRVICLKPGSSWTQGNERYAAYYWDDNGSHWTDMYKIGSGVYGAYIPAGYTNVILCRMNGSNSSNSWNTKWDQTADLTIGTYNCYTISSSSNGTGKGSWGNYTVSFTVAGEEGLCGSSWSNTATANDMIYNPATGLYEKIYPNVAAGTYKYKVLASHSWDYNWSNGSANDSDGNSAVTVAEGACHVLVTFDPATRTVKATSVAAHTESDAVEENRVDATCSAAGSYDSVVYCSVCGDELSRETKTIDKLAHTEGEAVEENRVDSTCSVAGSYEEVVNCSVCGEELSRTEKTIEKLAHTEDEAVEENRVDATCSAAGSYEEVVKCSVCGEELSRTEKTIDKLSHVDDNNNHVCDRSGCDVKVSECADENEDHKCDYAGCAKSLSVCVDNDNDHYCDYEGCTADRLTQCEDAAAVQENVVNSTCTVAGSYDSVIYCSICGEERSRETINLEMLDHNYGEWFNDGTDPTKHCRQCSACGDKQYTSHVGGSATCTVKAVCTNCGASYGELADHTYDNACDANCNVCGETRTPADHTGGTATCTAKAVCTVCGESYGDLAAHTYDNACDADCNVCGETRTPADHTGGSATCTAKAVCTVCGESYGDLAAHTFDGTSDNDCNVCGAANPEYVAPVKITLSVPDGVAAVEMGANNVLPSAGALDGYTFAGWSESTIDETTVVPTILEAGSTYTGDNQVLYAVYTRTATVSGPSSYVLTDITEIASTDVVVITMTKDSKVYAIANNNGTSSAPTAVVITVADGVITSDVADTIKWNIGGSEDAYIIYPNGQTSTWLYNTATNNGVRVGTNSDNKTFKIVQNSGSNGNGYYLFNNATSRYIGVYTTNPDWRCYTSVNTNIANQNIGFYVLKSSSVTTTYYLTMSTAACDHNYESVVTAPTCTEKGYTTYTCSKCGDSYIDNEVAATGHSHVESITTEATCTTAGLNTFTCSCGDSYDEAIDALGHNFVDGVCSRCDAVEPADVKYYLQATVDGTVYYWNGSVSSGKGGITSDVNNAVQLTIEIDGSNTYIYYVSSGTKTYLYFTDGNTGFKISTSVKTIKYDSVTGHVYEDSFAEARYASTYGTQDIRSYKASNINGTNVYMVMTPVGGSSAPECTEHTDANGDYKCDNDCGAIVPPAADAELTIEQALALGALYTKDNYTANKYYITGTIVDITNVTYGNMNIEDENGNKILVYGLYSADGNTRYDAMETKPVAGDTITVYGIIGYYSAPQMKDGWMTEHIPAECDHVDANGDYVCDNDGCDVVVPPAADSTLTFAQATLLGSLTTTTEKYYMTGTITEVVNTQYGNMYIKDADGNTFYIYGLYSADGNTRYDSMETKPVVGDEVTLYGIITSHEGNSQMKNAWLDEHVKHTHEYTGEETKEATCTEAGEMTYTCSICGDSYTEAIEKLDHTAGTAVEENRVESTCTVAGSYDSVVYCSVCSAEISRETKALDLAAHVMGGWSNYSDTQHSKKCNNCDYREYGDHTGGTATCTAKAVCTVCGTSYGELAAHTEVTDAAKAPTCTETGLTEGKHCSVCDTVIVAQEVVPATGHTEVTVPGTAATCTESGLTEGKKCSVCGTVTVEQTVVPALDHDIVVDAAVAPTCTETGLTAGQHCSRCDGATVAQETIPALDHEFVKGDCTRCDAIDLSYTVTVYFKNNWLWSDVCIYWWNGTNNNGWNTERATLVANDGTHDIYSAEVPFKAEGIIFSGIKNDGSENVDQTPNITSGFDNCVMYSMLWKDNKNQVEVGAYHTYTSEVITEADCLNAGEIKYTCSICGDSYTEAIDALGHDIVVDAAVAATCTESGLTAGEHCTRCDYKVAQTVVPALGHDIVVDKAVAPTCTATGLTEGSHCSRCDGATVAQEVVDKLDHTMGGWSQYDETQHSRVCSVCKSEDTREFANHTGGTATCKTQAICNDCGKAYGELAAHTEVTDAAKAPTCTETGLTEGKHCSVCNEVLVAQEVVEKLAHTEGEAVQENVVNATCSAAGSYDSVVYCSVCGEELSRTAKVIEKLPHTEGAAVQENVINATCSAAGSYDSVVYCSVCGVELSRETKAIEKLAHTEETVPGKAASCTETGLTDGKKCSVCGVTLVEQEVIDKLAHTEVIDAAKAPTCTETGLTEGKHCSVCNEVLVAQEVVDKLDHDIVIDAAVEPTCTETGLTEGKHCSVCETVLVAQEVVAANGHDFANGFCKVCGAADPDFVPVVEIDGVKYDSLQDAIDAAQPGETVKLVDDVDLIASLVLDGTNYDVILDLNGHTITADYNAEIVEVILAKNGAKLTITGEGTMLATGDGEHVEVISSIDGASVIINNGTFISDGCTAIYATRGGSVEINGGYYEARDPYYGVNYLLDINEQEAVLGVITVSGGQFIDFNPANHKNDGANGNKLAVGAECVGLIPVMSTYSRSGSTSTVYYVGEDVFEDVIANANDGDTIILESDITLDAGVVVNADITIDLNGKTISMEDSSGATAYAIKNNANLTIKDSAGDGKITFHSTTPSANNGYASNAISNYGTLTVESGTIENTTVGSACYAVDNYAGSTFTLNGGKLTAEKTTLRAFNWTNGESNKITITINDGEIISNDGYAINFNMGNSPAAELNINGGTITTNDTDYELAVYVYMANNGSAENLTVEVADGTFNGYFALNGVTSTTMAEDAVSLSGGSFKGVICYGDPAYGFISGGSYSVALDPALCADGFACVENSDGTYGIVEAVASINGVGYATLEEALAAANDGDTVLLLDDVVLSEILVLNKGIILDGNGHTLTSSAARAINVDCAGNVGIKNLTIVGAANTERAINIINSAVNLTVDNVKAEGFKYTLNVSASSVGSNITVNNSTLSGYAAVNITGANTVVTINNSHLKGVNNYSVNESNNFGTISIGSGVAADGVNLTVNGGTITTETNGNVQWALVVTGSKNVYAYVDAELILAPGAEEVFAGDADEIEAYFRSEYEPYLAGRGFLLDDAGDGMIGIGGRLNYYIGENGNWFFNGEDTGHKAVATDGETPYIKDGNWWVGETDTGVRAEAINGTTPHIGDNGNWFIGETDTGVKAAGTDGTTPHIGDNGNWFLGTTDTGVKAEGVIPHIGENGNWIIGTTDTGVKASGADGVTPHIGDNGNWFIGTTDTGVKAAGTDGNDGDTPYIGENGNWFVGTTDLGVSAKGDKGETPTFKIENGKLWAKFPSDADWTDLGQVVGANGNDGREVEFRTTDTDIEWRYVGEGDNAWRQLVALDDIKGSDGNDGREVEFRTTDTHIEWRYVGEDDNAWRQLVALDDIKGSDGGAGSDGNDGREVEFRTTDTHIEWRYVGEGDNAWRQLVALDDIKGSDGGAGSDGDDGREVELRKTETHLEWRYVGEGDDAWRQLVALDDIKGSDGEIPSISENGNWVIGGVETVYPAVGKDGKTPHIGDNGNWFIGDDDTGVAAKAQDGKTPHIGENGNWFIGDDDTGVAARGQDGRTPAFKIEDGHLHVSFDGEKWEDLGNVTGESGKTPHIGENGNWFIGEEDTGILATGSNGAAGTTPHIGENGNWFIGDVDTGIAAQGKDGNSNNEIVLISIGIAALCLVTTLIALVTRKRRYRWWILS